ncbi:D-amino-acid transaminase [Halalkalibacillus halophilus]|uniref:D-amino-acid transaminase n=1 Tax=Halalkalibacillus halophilus TaxID=392827 RepID=UPI0004132ACE|nr:D-amino-acid transaminase [Halalkalibacillus halophilus]
MIVLKNNTFIERKEATIDMEDRGFQFGDGVYEVIRVYNGEYFLLEDHIKRLQYSLNEIGITYDLEENGLRDDLIELLEANEVEDGGIYLQVSRGIAPRAHPYPSDAQPTLFAYPIHVVKPVAEQGTGVQVILEEDFRWLRCDIKSLNLLGNVMTKQKAKENGAFEAIFYRNEDHVTEGSSTNVFVVKDGTLYTHPADNYILNGITRRYILHVAEETNVPVEETVFSLDFLHEADEVFVASTTAEIVPVVQIENEVIANGKPGDVTKQLLQSFAKHQSLETLPVN